MEKILTEEGTWFFIVPIKNVILTKDVKYEFTIDRIRLFDIKKLPRIRKKIGFPYKFSEFKKKYSAIYEKFFNPYQTFATFRQTGTGEITKQKFLATVREELAILSFSQLGESRRYHNACPALAEEVATGQLSYFMMNLSTKHWIQWNETTGKMDKIILNKLWLKRQKDSFFLDLIKIFRKDIKVSNSWYDDLKNAAILAGQSQSSSDLPQCFLSNMIAIELLLTKQGDSYSDKLPERAEAILVWMLIHWGRDKFREAIRGLYAKRCSLVHSGNRSAIKIPDLLLSDTILLNLFINIVKHPKIFYSKEKLIEFSEKVQAEYVLNIKPKIRPKTFRYRGPVYSKSDYEKI